MISVDSEAKVVARRDGIFSARRLFAIHAWLGMSLGLVLAIICGSGAVAVFGHEIDWLLNPALRVQPQPKRASFDEIQAKVSHAFPDAVIVWWQIQEGMRYADILELVPRGTEGDKDLPITRAYVNPYTGEVQGTDAGFSAKRFLRAFHYYWFDTRTGWGFYLVSAFALVLLGATVTGMVIYRRWWKGFFLLRLWRGPRVLFSDLHKLCGAWTLVFNILIAVTAIYYLMEWIAGDLGNHWEKTTPKLSAERMAKIVPGTQPLSIDQQIANARTHFPALRIANIAPPLEANAPLYLDGQANAWLVRERANKLLLDPYDGSLVYIQRAEELSAAWRWVDTVDSLHFGNFAGLFSKVIWFVLGLMIPVLFVTGAWLGFRRAGPIGRNSLRDLRNPLNVVGVGITVALLIFATISTVYSVREAIAEVPMKPRQNVVGN